MTQENSLKSLDPFEIAECHKYIKAGHWPPFEEFGLRLVLTASHAHSLNVQVQETTKTQQMINNLIARMMNGMSADERVKTINEFKEEFCFECGQVNLLSRPCQCWNDE